MEGVLVSLVDCRRFVLGQGIGQGVTAGPLGLGDAAHRHLSHLSFRGLDDVDVEASLDQLVGCGQAGDARTEDHHPRRQDVLLGEDPLLGGELLR